MSPLFSLALVVVVAIPIAAIVFLAAKTFVPVRHAALMAFAAPVAGVVGCAIGAISQIPFYPSNLTSGGMVLSFLGITLAMGAMGAGLAIWAIWKMTQLTNSN
jgi:hypothetical protein